MKKFSLFSILVILALVLVACGGAGDSSQMTPGAEEGIATEDLSGTGDLATEQIVTEEMPGSNDLATEVAPTMESTEVGSLGTQLAGTSIPNTGAGLGEFARLSQLISDLSLVSADGADLGAIQDFVINFPADRVDYLVVDLNGQSVLVPFSSLAFDRENNGGYVFGGNVDLLNSAPAFAADAVDFSVENWDTDVVDFWRNGLVNNSASGTPVAVATQNMSPAAPTAAVATPLPAATQSSTMSPADQGLNDGPAFENVRFAVLYSELIQMQVVHADSAGDDSSLGSAEVGATMESTSSAVATPAATLQSNATDEPMDGESIGQVVDALVNLTSGELPYLFLSLNDADLSSSGSMGSSSTAQPTQEVTAAGGGSDASGDISSDLDGSFVVPFRFFEFVDEDTLALTFTGDLAGAPVFNASDFSGPLNFGWDNTFLNFWNQSGNSDGGASDMPAPTATP